MSSSRGAGPSEPPSRRITRMQTARKLGESIFDNEVVPSSLVEIVSILRVANEVEKAHPVAYLYKCSTSILHPSCSWSCYAVFDDLDFIVLYVAFTLLRKLTGWSPLQALQNDADKAERAQLTKAYQTMNVLFELLKAVNMI